MVSGHAADHGRTVDNFPRARQLQFSMPQGAESEHDDMSFKFNESALRRELEKQAQSAMDTIARDRSRQLDALRRQYAGRPTSEIRPALQRVFRQDGGQITEPELTEYAEAISAGTRIIIKAGRIRW